jgi:hypothetical protein
MSEALKASISHPLTKKTVSMTFPTDGWDLSVLGQGEDGCFHCMLTAYMLVLLEKLS